MIQVEDIYFGSQEVNEVYLGNILVWKRLHPNTIKLLLNAQTRGIALPDWDFILIINEVIIGFVNSGFWDLLDTFYLFAGGSRSSQNFKRLNWINPALNFGNFGGDLSAAFLDYGLSGNTTGGGASATAVYFNTNRLVNASGSKYTLNDASLGTLCFRQATSIQGDITSYISSTSTGRTPSLTPATNFSRLNAGSGAVAANFLGLGLMILNRTSANDVNSINKANQLNHTRTSTVLGPSYTFSALQMGTPLGTSYHCNAGLSLMFTGKNIPMSIAQLIRTVINEKLFRPLGLTEIA